ncbi:MAG: hypothetical protein WCL18_00280 [bacterium]
MERDNPFEPYYDDGKDKPKLFDEKAMEQLIDDLIKIHQESDQNIPSSSDKDLKDQLMDVRLDAMKLKKQDRPIVKKMLEDYDDYIRQIENIRDRTT